MCFRECPSVGVSNVVLCDTRCLLQSSPRLSQWPRLSPCATSGLCAAAFGCAVSRSVEGAAFLHIFSGARSCSFGIVGGVSIKCGCELCLVGVVFVVARRVGATSPSSLLCSSCLENCLVFSWSCSRSCLLMMVSRESSSSSCGVGQPLLRAVKSALRGRSWPLVA